MALSQSSGIVPQRSWESDFHFAARTGDLKKVNAFLETGFGVDKRDQRGNTALFAAAQYGQRHIVERLLGAGASVDAPHKWHLTPLLISILWSEPDVALLLLDHHPNPNQISSMHRRSPLTLAAEFRLPTVVAALIRLGADLNHADSSGFTAEALARSRGLSWPDLTS